MSGRREGHNRKKGGRWAEPKKRRCLLCGGIVTTALWKKGRRCPDCSSLNYRGRWH